MSGSTSLVATMVTSRRTISRRNTWFACGGNCNPEMPNAATWDDNGERFTANLLWAEIWLSTRKHISLMGDSWWSPATWLGVLVEEVVLDLHWFVHSFGWWLVSAADSDTWSMFIRFVYTCGYIAASIFSWPRSFVVGGLGCIPAVIVYRRIFLLRFYLTCTEGCGWNFTAGDLKLSGRFCLKNK